MTTSINIISFCIVTYILSCLLLRKFFVNHYKEHKNDNPTIGEFILVFFPIMNTFMVICFWTDNLFSFIWSWLWKITSKIFSENSINKFFGR